MNTRIFWLRSDNKTVQEITLEERRKHFNDGRHYVQVHCNGDFYTTKNWISGIQFAEVLERIRIEKAKA